MGSSRASQTNDPQPRHAIVDKAPPTDSAPGTYFEAERFTQAARKLASPTVSGTTGTNCRSCSFTVSDCTFPSRKYSTSIFTALVRAEQLYLFKALVSRRTFAAGCSMIS